MIAGVLSDIDAALAHTKIRSHDPAVSFHWVTKGLQSLSFVSAKHKLGVISSIQLVVGSCIRGAKFTKKHVVGIQHTCFLFCALYRNMMHPTHSEDDIAVW